MDSSVIGAAMPGVGLMDPTKHVNYTFGMVLGVDDFVQDFGYLTARDRQLARELIGYGTVRGLLVEAGPDPVDPDLRERVTVTRGLAITPLGQPVCVPVDQCAYIAPWLRTHAPAVQEVVPLGGSLPVYVTLCFRDRPTDDVPIPGEPCRSEDELMAPSRLQDDFALELRLQPPPQVEEDAIRDVVAWIRQIPLLASGGSSIEDVLDALRAAAAPSIAGSPPEIGSPPDFGSPPWDLSFDALLGAPDPSLAIPADEAADYVRAILRLWVTELRPRWALDAGCGAEPCAPGKGDDAADCLLLAELSVPVTWDSGTPITTGGPIDVRDDRRPFLVHTRMLQEWLLTAETAPSIGFGSPPAAGAGFGAVVAAGRAGPLGGLTTPPQFRTPGVAVSNLQTGIYRITFPGYDASRDYVLTGAPVTDVTDATRQMEIVVDGAIVPALDPALGLHIRISTVGGVVVNSAFVFQVADYTVGP